tara:strand:- start:1783 stop:1980 length:198 start_codon:yes stop_codon:yes gene_type:complete
MNKFFEFLGGRKMFFALILTIVVSVFLFTDKCNFDQWSNFCIWVFGSYAIGNGVAHIGSGLNKKG